MSIANVLPLIESLSHTDKYKLMQALLGQLAQEEGINLRTGEETESVVPSPKPVGRVYHSGRRDVSVQAEELLFADKVSAAHERRT